MPPHSLNYVLNCTLKLQRLISCVSTFTQIVIELHFKFVAYVNYIFSEVLGLQLQFTTFTLCFIAIQVFQIMQPSKDLEICDVFSKLHIDFKGKRFFSEDT